MKNSDLYLIILNIVRAVLQDVKSYDETRDSLALLKILAMSTKSIESGNYKPLHQAFSDLDERKKQIQ